MGYKDGYGACVRFGQIKKALGWSGTASPTTTLKKPRATEKATGAPERRSWLSLRLGQGYQGRALGR